jgi:hypothetical protein
VVRRNASGFVHDRQKNLLRPSLANLSSMDYAISLPLPSLFSLLPPILSLFPPSSLPPILSLLPPSSSS